MPKITAIKPQLKRSDRYSIFIDEQFAFSLSADQLVETKIGVGDELTGEQVAGLVEASGFGKMLDRTYNYLSFRQRSRYEVETYLRRKHCDEPTIEQIIARLNDQGLIDDHRFAEAWVSERREFDQKSQRQLVAELRQKGIDSKIISEVVSSGMVDSEIEVIKELIRRRSLDRRYPDQSKLIKHLQGKGFSYNDIRAALEQLDNLS